MPHKAFEFATTLCWAIEPSYLTMLLAIANREGAGPEAVAARIGRPLENAPKVQIRDGVAVVPVHGPIFRRASMFTEVSGATSVAMLARDFRAALDAPEVSAIVLDIDSPGGEANGINEFAAMVREARGKKPVCAYVGGMAASAAYWIACAADEIVADDTAEVGSIGCVMAVTAPDATSSRQVEIVSSVSPNKRPNVATKAGHALYQKRCDDAAAIFVENVARNRNVSVETVLEKFGKGGVLIAREAIAAGMIDNLGSLEGTIARFAVEPAPASAPSIPPAAPCTDPECDCGCHESEGCTDPQCQCSCHAGEMRAQALAAHQFSDIHQAERHLGAPFAHAIRGVFEQRPVAVIPVHSPANAAASTQENPPMAAAVIQLVTLAAVLGMSASASEEEVTGAIASHRKTRDELLKVTGKATEAEALGAISALRANSEQLVVVRAENDQLKAEQRDREIAAILEDGQKAGKLPPAKVAWAREIGGNDPAKLRALVDGLEPAVATKPVETAAGAGAVAGETNEFGLSAEDRKTCSLLRLDPKEFAAEKAKLTSAQA